MFKQFFAIISAFPEKLEGAIQRTFSRLGRFVGRNPLPNIFVPLVIAILLSLGFFGFGEVNDVRLQFTPYNSPSHYEHAVGQEFLQGQGKLYTLLLVILPKNGKDSLLEPGPLQETENFIKYAQNDMKVDYGGKRHSFFDVCRSYCDANEPLGYFLATFKSKASRRNPNFKLKYPIMEIFGKSMYIGTNLHGVETDDLGNVISANIIQLLFYSIADNTSFAILTKWEEKLEQWINNMQEKHIRVLINSDTLIRHEVRRTGLSVIPYFVLSFIAVISFTTLTSFRRELFRSKVLESIAGVLGPLIAGVGSFGSLLLLGLDYQPICTVTIFLILAIGVDDVFMMLRAWHKTDPSLSVVERMSGTLAESGPSITITSLTNALSFAVGIFSDTPAIRTFCIYTTTTIVLSYLFQISFFSGILTLSGRREAKGINPCCCLVSVNKSKAVNNRLFDWISDFQKRLLRSWTGLLVSWPMRILVVILLAVYWLIAFWGFTKMRVEITLKKLVLADSPLIEVSDIYIDRVWTETQQLTIIVNNPGDLKQPNILHRNHRLVAAFENATHSEGHTSTQFWLYPYTNYMEFYDVKQFEYGKLSEFLMGGSDEHWRAHLRLDEQSCALEKSTCVKAYMFTTGFTNVSQFSFRKQLLDEWRLICADFSDLNVTVYDPYSYFADQVTSIKETTKTTVIMALVCMALVCLIFIPNLVSIACAAVSVLSINVGVVGFLTHWNVDLDPISMASLLMSIGFSVDFTAHMSYHYYKGNAKTPIERLEKAFDSIAWPTIQAGVSTVLGCIVLFLHSSYLISVFVKTVLLVCAFGFVHGLLILPVGLAALPFQKNCSPVSPPNQSITENIPKHSTSSTRWLVRNSLRNLWKSNEVSPKLETSQDVRY